MLHNVRAVKTADFHPHRCLCSNGEGPFVDTGYEFEDGQIQAAPPTKESPYMGLPGPRVYLCGRCAGLVVQIRTGMEPDAITEMKQENLALRETIARLGEELAYERDHKVVSISDAVKVVDRARQAAAKKAATAETLVTATEINGEKAVTGTAKSQKAAANAP